MPDLLLISIEYGGYISIIKFIIFLLLFFPLLPLLGWVYKDAMTVGTKETFWTGVILAAAAVATIIWLLLPVFIIGVLLYLAALISTSLVYVNHRNARVMEYDRVLTANHIKGLFISKAKKLEALKALVFITANENEVPVPQPKTADFYGYKAAYELFTDANYRRADKIALLPTPQNYNVIYHIDGVATKQPTMPPDQAKYFIRFVKHLADLDINEKRKPQKGKFRISHHKGNTDWQVITAGSTIGEQVKIEQIVQYIGTRLPDIGLTTDQLEQLNKIREQKQGLFIISGPKKAGITTTFYALLRNHDAFLNNINTLETELSAELPNITQNLFTATDTDTTYAKKLQAIVRMGPDIMGVADCEDAETAKVACLAAKDGKIMYVTFQASSVITAFAKWIKLVGDRNLAIETLLGISNQRLIRKLCTQCRQAYAPNKELLRKFNLSAQKVKVLYRPGKVEYDKHGKPITCENCQGTGFVGRTGVFEIIIISEQLRDAINQAKSLQEIAIQFRHAKMLYLQEQALRKVIAGITSINEMIRVLSATKKQKAKA